MQKIRDLSLRALRTGEARSAQDDTGGAWASAIGLNPFLSDDTSRFLLAATATPTRIGESEITDIPIAYANGSTSSASGIYLLGSGGRFYSVNDSNTVSVIRPQSTLTALTNPTGGMMPVTDSGGNKYIFICARQTLYRWNLNTADSASHWNASNGLFSSNHHPMHKFADSVYFGNAQYLARIPLDELHNQATTLTNIEFQLINFGASQNVTAIGDDGRYTLVAHSAEFDETDDVVTEARIVWYPNVGTNWDWEVSLKGERAVRAIVRNALGVFAIGEQTVYQLAFGAQPKLVRTFSNDDRPGGAFNAIAQDVGPRADIAKPFGDSLIFGRRGAIFGRRYPAEPVTFSHPLQGHTDDISLIAPDFIKSRIYVGTEDSKFWYYNMASAGNTSNTWTTRWFDLGGDFTITRIEVELPAGIAASDVTGISVEVPSGQTASVALSQAAVDSLDRTYAKLNLDPNIQGSRVRFNFTPSAGAPKLGGIKLYGEPRPE